MKAKKTPLTIGTGKSKVVNFCQICHSQKLEKMLFLGYLPPVNTMPKIGEIPHEQPSYPALLLKCRRCLLFQLGLIVDPKILFPPDYPYTSGTTKILRDNFAELYDECKNLVNLRKDDLIVDIGSNDGTLLANFAKDYQVLGIEPANVGNIANKRGIETLISFFDSRAAAKVRKKKGLAKIVTATNVFAHIEDVHSVIENILSILKPEGIFITESHYLYSLIKTVQYDTIYHEHLRYYSLHSLNYLLRMHNLVIFHAKKIPPHGGSIRVYAARPGHYQIRSSVNSILKYEKQNELKEDKLRKFCQQVMLSKLKLHSLLYKIKNKGKRIYGIGAPSRASTLINFVGLDEMIIDCVVEVKNSQKIGKYIPGTLIPVIDEEALFKNQPEYALLLSWHIAKELVPKLTQKGFQGDYIIPLPTPRIIPRRLKNNRR